ncbi:hypothetical protein BCR44DRAFT_1457194 [Catenaria anguillulae PL171]|uniref:Uncharacterized protein n=1 Tax=Catenaria anguillulae PL171 TaxID=765915 RepID=A0A1Y2I5W9_9FUNG|nr:hypothetical protein BCR44DRAFT_1457194 [Catenaria anguillulae PL171]
MAPGLPLPKASASTSSPTATPPPSDDPNSGSDPPPSDPPLFIYVATALGVFLLALFLYYLRHRRRHASGSSASAAISKPPRVPSSHLAATEPYRPDPESTPPVPPIPRRFLRESSQILETHATHHAVDLLESQARAKRKSSRPADRKADFRDHYNGPPGPLLIREDRDAVLLAATMRATMSAAQREEEERKRAEKRKKKRAAAASSSAMPLAATTMAPGMELMAEKQAQADAKMKAYQERLERHEARQRAKMASSKALEPITPLLFVGEIADLIRDGPPNNKTVGAAPLSPTPSSSSTILSTMSGPSSAFPLPVSPLSPASLDDVHHASTDPWLVPLPASPLSPTSLDSGVIIDASSSGGPLSPITEEEPDLPADLDASKSIETRLQPSKADLHRRPILDPAVPPAPSTAAATARRSRASTLAKAGRAVHSMDAIMFHKVSQTTLEPSASGMGADVVRPRRQ